MEGGPGGKPKQSAPDELTDGFGRAPAAPLSAMPDRETSGIVFGRHPVLEALRSGENLKRILIAQGTASRGSLAELLAEAKLLHVPVEWVPRSVLDRAVAGIGSGKHQGVVALAGEYRYADLMQILATAMRRGESPFLLVLDALQDVHNLGGLIRTAVAVGVHGVLLPERGAVGVTPAVRKASAGAVGHVAVARLSLLEALDELRRRGLRVVGLAAEAELVYWEADLTGSLAVVVGGEAHGLHKGVRRRCDMLVRLPMLGPVSSLNANVAGSVVLYEALRQRRGEARGRGGLIPGLV